MMEDEHEDSASESIRDMACLFSEIENRRMMNSICDKVVDCPSVHEHDHYKPHRSGNDLKHL